MKRLIFVLVVFFGIVNIHSQEIFKPGDIEASGQLQFSAYEQRNSPTTYNLALLPNISFFLNNCLYIGPTLHYNLSWNKNYWGHIVGLGGGFGYVFPSSLPVSPYLGTSYTYAYDVSSYDSPGMSNYNTSNTMTELEIYAGLKYLLATNVLLNIQPTFSIYNFGESSDVYSNSKNDFNILGIRIGISSKIFSRN